MTDTGRLYKMTYSFTANGPEVKFTGCRYRRLRTRPRTMWAWMVLWWRIAKWMVRR